jgi:hypothetical protein
MLSFFYESTIILGFVYCFHFLLLKKNHSFVYVRFYFLAALLLALIIPFIEIKTNYHIPVTGSGDKGLYYAFLPFEAEGVPGKTQRVISIGMVIWITYFLGLLLMFVRFVSNLIRLVRKRKTGEIVKGPYGNIVLTDDYDLPHSFFRMIYMNRLLFNKSKDAEKLLLHEGIHCKQVHSIDILFVELLKVVLWFNPFIWLIANAMRLNHEYLADKKVIEAQDLHAYQLLLINLGLANPCANLASGFNYSLIKKRLAMMNNKYKGKDGILRKLVAIPLFTILVIVLTFCENDAEPVFVPFETMEFQANDWWRPILARHEITPRAYNNFEYIFEMGSTNSIDEENVVTLRDAFFLIRNDENTYAILRSPSATHDLKTGIISGAEGRLEAFDLFQEEPEPLSQMEMKNFKFQLIEQKYDISADYMVLYEHGEGKARGLSGSFAARDSLVVNKEGN